MPRECVVGAEGSVEVGAAEAAGGGTITTHSSASQAYEEEGLGSEIGPMRCGGGARQVWTGATGKACAGGCTSKYCRAVIAEPGSPAAEAMQVTLA